MQVLCKLTISLDDAPELVHGGNLGQASANSQHIVQDVKVVNK
jgi:hypothetical protein